MSADPKDLWSAALERTVRTINAQVNAATYGPDRIRPRIVPCANCGHSETFHIGGGWGCRCEVDCTDHGWKDCGCTDYEKPELPIALSGAPR